MNIVLFGAPLSGKGTQADLIKSEYGLVHISTGDMLREIAKQNTDLGFQVHKLLEEGKLVPDDVIIKVLKEKLISINSGNGIILDGFPRTLYQAEILEDVLHIDYVIYLNTSKQNIINRISGRYVCEDCKKTMALTEQNQVCSSCGGKLVKREDDNEATVIKRYDAFIDYGTPVLDFYRKNGKLIEFDGDVSIQEVFNQIKSRLK